MRPLLFPILLLSLSLPAPAAARGEQWAVFETSFTSDRKYGNPFVEIQVEIDPLEHPLTYHAPEHPRQAIKDNAAFDFDMVGIGHNGYQTAAQALELMKSCLEKLEPGVRYAAFYFDPATGRRFDRGIVESTTGEFRKKRVPSPQDWVLVLVNTAGK